MMTKTTMTMTMTNDLFFGNNQPWSDAFLAEGWWVISMMMTTMRMMTMATTMRTFLTRTYDDDNNNDNDGDKRPCFFRRQPTLVRCIPGRGVVGDFYDDDKDEDDKDGDYNEEDHCPCLFQKVLPMKSKAMPTVRTTTTTSFYDMTQ